MYLYNISNGNIGAHTLCMALHMPFDSPAAKQLNFQIFKTIYHGVLEASVDMAEKDGPYETWVGSPTQQGQLQFDLWWVMPLICGIGLC